MQSRLRFGNRHMLKKLLIIPLLVSSSLCASELEVLHWWTSGGEASSAQLLEETIEEQGHTWKDFAIPGGGGESAMAVLKARAVSGNPPTAAQIKGHDIQEWAKLGFLTDLEAVAKEEKWDQVLPPFLADIMRYKGQYVAAPVNIHRVNWLWVNPKVFKAVGVEIPTTLRKFFIAADAIKANGYIPLAYGGGSWQDATLFEMIALAVLDAKEYRQAFVELDMEVLASSKMVEVFRYFKKLKEYVDADAQGRTWNEATNMVIRGDAAMQLMGDWAKGEFTTAGKRPNRDYLCITAPGTEGKFSYNIDSFVFFNIVPTRAKQGQEDLAKVIMSKSFQQVFSLTKGSIPARTDFSRDLFDACSLDSMLALEEAEKRNTLLPSISQGMATSSYVQHAITDIVSDFFHTADADPQQAAQRLAKAIKAAM